MELDFINAVKKECVGYSFGDISFAKNAKTINEILHFMHSFILNSKHILLFHQLYKVSGQSQVLRYFEEFVFLMD